MTTRWWEYIEKGVTDGQRRTELFIQSCLVADKKRTRFSIHVFVFWIPAFTWTAHSWFWWNISRSCHSCCGYRFIAPGPMKKRKLKHAMRDSIELEWNDRDWNGNTRLSFPMIGTNNVPGVTSVTVIVCFLGSWYLWSGPATIKVDIPHK